MAIKTLESNRLLLVNVADGEAEHISASYSFSYNDEKNIQKEIFQKFVKSDGTYSYLPQQLTISAKLLQGEPLEDTFLICYGYYQNINGDTVSVELAPLNNDNSEEIIISLNNYSKYNFDFINVNFYCKNETTDANGLIKKEDLLISSEVKQIVYGTTADMAKLALNATDIVASIQSTNLIFSSTGLTIQGGGLTILGENNQPVFYVNQEGNLSFSGELNTSVGGLGSWEIDKYGLSSENGQVGLYAGESLRYPNDNSSDSYVRFWAGKQADNSYNFAVSNKGALYATQADISGKIIAKNGRIENKMLVGQTENGVIIYGGDETVPSYISSSSFSSGQSGYGWKISQDGSATFDNAMIRGKISSSVFEYEKISSVGGSLYISPTIYLEKVSGTIGEVLTILDIEEPGIVQKKQYEVSIFIPKESLLNYMGHDWSIGDEIKLSGQVLIDSTYTEIKGEDCIIVGLTANKEKKSTEVTLRFTSEKTLNNGIIQPGAALVLYGTINGRRGLYLTAQEANSPYIDVYNNTSLPAVRIGNLSGIVDSNFPNMELNGYGLYSSNAYLTGQLMLPGAGITNQDTLIYGENESRSPIRIWAGIDDDQNDITSANFIVTANGCMYAKKGVFEGTVRANNSEFSGTIKAAGIVVEEGGVGTKIDADKDHFFVAYKEQPESFNDYILDIGSHGLSIWEGGLRAYSDEANNTSVNSIYGYKENYGQEQPLPYFTLADDYSDNELNARIVAHKGHFLVVSEQQEKYQAESIIFNKGIWFSNVSGLAANLKNIEKTVYYQNEQKTGIYYNNSLLKFKNKEGGFFFETDNTFYLNVKEEDISQFKGTESMLIHGQVKIINKKDSNMISLNQQQIIEAKDDNNNSIGINIIIQ